MADQELYHHGIKGMRWGIRRTPAQLGRAKKSRRDNWSDDAKTASSIKKKRMKEMSNAELKKLNERTRLENEYRNLNPRAVKRGMKVMGAVAGTMGTALALYNNSKQVGDLVKKGKPIVDKVVDKAGDVAVKAIFRNILNTKMDY